jgi:GNAT superfamily N-acetyltransferase
MEIRTYGAALSKPVLKFLQDRFPGTVKSDPAYFDWKFAENPLAPSAIDGYYVAVDHGEVVGQIATMTDELALGDRSLPCAWVVDLMVAPEHRGRGLVALRLLKELMDRHDLVLANGMGAEPARLYEGLRWRQAPSAELTTFQQVLRPSRSFGVAGPGRRRALSLLDGPVERFWRGRAGATDAAPPLDRFDDDVDGLVQALRPVLGPTSHRSSRYYRWRFERRPYGTHVALGVRQQGVLRGLLVARIFERPGRRWAAVADVLADPADEGCFQSLLAGATAEAFRSGCDVVRFSLSHPGLVSQLRRPRWLRRREPTADRVYVHARDAAVGDLVVGSQWHMTGLISDRVETGEDETGTEP